MTKTLITFLLFIHSLWAIDVPIEEADKQIFQEEITMNSKIIQLSSSKSLVMAQLGGKIVKYLVKKGDKVKKGQALALISLTSTRELSLQIAPLKVELKALKNRLSISNRNYAIIKKLYLSGVESKQKLNLQEEERANINSDIAVVKSKLSTFNLGKNTSDNTYTIYAQSTGIINDILVSPNAVVESSRALISIIKGEESFLIQSYVPLKYASQLKVGQKGQLLYGDKAYKMDISQILPELDEETQQIVIHSTLKERVKNLFVNAYVDSKLFIAKEEKYLAVKKSALSFFNNEWVVFVPKHHEEHENHKEEKHEEHKGHGHDETTKEKHDEHEEEDGHGHDETKKEKHDKHGEEEGHEEEEVPYDIRVVKIIKQNDTFVAIEGLEEHEDYVSGKSYYVKSLLLKSSLGGHGH